MFLGKLESFRSASPLGLAAILETNNQSYLGFPLCMIDKREAKEPTWIFRLTPCLIFPPLTELATPLRTYPAWRVPVETQ